MVFINRHISNLRLDLSICRLYSALVSIEVFYAAAPANWVSAADTLKVPSEPRRGQPETFLLSEKSHTKCFISLRQIVKDFLFAELFDGKKRH